MLCSHFYTFSLMLHLKSGRIEEYLDGCVRNPQLVKRLISKHSSRCEITIFLNCHKNFSSRMVAYCSFPAFEMFLLFRGLNSFATGIVKTVFFLNGYKNSRKFVRILSRLADLIIQDKFLKKISFQLIFSIFYIICF